jgi:hypothetical protein
MRGAACPWLQQEQAGPKAAQGGLLASVCTVRVVHPWWREGDAGLVLV